MQVLLQRSDVETFLLSSLHLVRKEMERDSMREVIGQGESADLMSVCFVSQAFVLGNGCGYCVHMVRQAMLSAARHGLTWLLPYDEHCVMINDQQQAMLSAAQHGFAWPFTYDMNIV